MKIEKAIFAAGCFWQVQEKFDKIKGVVKTRVGYSGGKTRNPTYQKVCLGKTGHVESIEIIFNPKKISYENLLDKFWKVHDATTKDRQGFDIGTHYNSVIFYHNLKQKNLAEGSKKEIQEKTDKKIVTEIKSAGDFWEAEEYHQKYVEKRLTYASSKKWKMKGFFGRLFG